MSYLRGLYLDSFQTTKRHSYDGYSIYIEQFSTHSMKRFTSLPSTVVGVTTNRSCFTRIIGHDARTIDRNCTKCDDRIRLWTPFLCAKFQGDRNTRFRYNYSNFCKCAKIRRKKSKLALEARISEWLERFPSNLVWRLPWLTGNFVANLVPIG